MFRSVLAGHWQFSHLAWTWEAVDEGTREIETHEEDDGMGRWRVDDGFPGSGRGELRVHAGRGTRAYPVSSKVPEESGKWVAIFWTASGGLQSAIHRIF